MKFVQPQLYLLALGLAASLAHAQRIQNLTPTQQVERAMPRQAEMKRITGGRVRPVDALRPNEVRRITSRPSSTNVPRPEEMRRLMGQQVAPVEAPRPEVMARLSGRPAAPRDMPRPEEMRRLMGQPNETELTSHRHHKANDGQEVHSPARSTHDQMPAGASAKCRDGTYSFSQHRQGTCSQHSGVAIWL